MSLFLTTAFGVLATTAALPADPRGLPNSPKPECRKTTALPAHGQPPQLRQLGKLPPADHYAAVYRTVNGCEVPLILTRRPTSR